VVARPRRPALRQQFRHIPRLIYPDFLVTTYRGLHDPNTMAEQEFVFVEDPYDDNGADWINAWVMHPRCSRAKSVKDFIDEVDAKTKPGDCIKSILLCGHGDSGDFSVGNGISGTDPEKEITLKNENIWGPLLDRLTCRFCSGGSITLQGCEVGSGPNGALLLFRIKQRLKCATVFAPVIEVRPYTVVDKDDWQVVTPYTAKPPKPKTPPAPVVKKKKKGWFSAAKIVAGETMETLAHFDGKEIVAVRYLPRILGHPFSAELLAGPQAFPIGRKLLHLISSGLDAAQPEDLSAASYLANGYIQFCVRQGGQKHWQPPGFLMGSCRLYSPLRTNTTVAYSLGKHASRAMKKFHAACVLKVERSGGKPAL
jgi:hypothetical protein